MKLYLTSGIEANDSCLDGLGSLRRINIGDLIRIKKCDLPDTEIDKLDIVIEWLIKECDQEVLIGYALSSTSDYMSLKERLIETDFRIQKVFLRLNNYYPKYKKDYDKFSNWLDYPPEFIKNKDEKSNIELRKLSKLLKQDNVLVDFVD